MIPILQSAAVLLFAAACMAAAPQKGTPVGKVELIRGGLELNRVGTQDWVFTDTTLRLMDSDRLRTPKNAATTLLLPGGLKLFLAGDTKVRIESRSQGKQKIYMNTVTLYYGGCYLQTPDEGDSLFQHSVVTPSASLSARGGAGFSVNADRESGTSQVIVLNGMVTARNILYEKTAYLPSGKLLVLDLGRDFDPPRAADSLDLAQTDWLKAVDTGLVHREQEKARVKREQIRAILSGGAKDRIVVTRFFNRSDYNGLWDIEKGLSGMTLNMLKQTTTLSVDMTGSYTSEKTMDSLKTKATIAVVAYIPVFILNKETRLGTAKGEAQSYLDCRVEVAYTLIHPADNRTLTTFTVSENIKEKETPGNTFKEIVDRPFSLNDKIFYECIVGRALQSVMNKAGKQMKEYLGL